MDPKTPKPKKPRKPKIEKSERELVEAYAQKVLNAATSTMVDRKDLHAIVAGHGTEVRKTATMLAMDRDFYFSVVFQTADQKYQFLEALAAKLNLPLETSADEAVDIVNGLKLAAALDIPLKLEKPISYPVSDVQLLPFVLDTE